MHTNKKNTFKVTLLLNTFNSFKLKQKTFYVKLLLNLFIKLLYLKI
jgi:hypothetical protein